MNEEVQKPSCLLLIGKVDYLNKYAILFAEQVFDLLAIVGPDNKDISEEELAELKPDYVFSFLNERILIGPLLKLKNVNFHPAPPEWPGRGSASLAIYHGSKTYGATAHIMDIKIDAGSILAVKRFDILSGESCESLFNRGESACLDLFYDILTYIVQNNDLPPPSEEIWKRKAMSRKQFEEWLVIDLDNKEDFCKKIKAAKHSKFPGPYVIIHGHKFSLIE